MSPWHEWFGGVDALSGLLPDAAQRAEFVSELDPLAWEMLEEPRPACAGWPTAPVGFLLLSEAYQGEADAAEERGWPTLRIVGHHLSTVTDARTVAEQLLKLESRVGGQSKAGR